MHRRLHAEHLELQLQGTIQLILRPIGIKKKKKNINKIKIRNQKEIKKKEKKRKEKNRKEKKRKEIIQGHTSTLQM